jgi:geranylgeranyl pyrophosphate synthase
LADVCEGQIAETERVGDPSRSASQYVETIRRKTAALFRAACELGALTSGADDTVRERVVDYGENLGLAFQVVDDLLDFVGDPRVTGKTPGTDLREGVFTLPVLIANQRDPAIAAELEPGKRELGRVLPMLESTGALDAAFDQARFYVDQASDSLSQLPDSEWRSVLETISEGVLAQVRPAA